MASKKKTRGRVAPTATTLNAMGTVGTLVGNFAAAAMNPPLPGFLVSLAVTRHGLGTDAFHAEMKNEAGMRLADVAVFMRHIDDEDRAWLLRVFGSQIRVLGGKAAVAADGLQTL